MLQIHVGVSNRYKAHILPIIIYSLALKINVSPCETKQWKTKILAFRNLKRFITLTAWMRSSLGEKHKHTRQ